ncbi:MAG: beta strand repeat-containing protein [Pyrinomonadaceae bacterium]
MKRTFTEAVPRTLVALLAGLAITCACGLQALAQTPGGTAIQNQASATYSDGSGNNFNTVSNTVTVTVANVSGLAITPDAGTRPTVVAGQTTAVFSFNVTNTGNFADQVRFLANGASAAVTGPATISAMAIDLNGNGQIDASDTDIKNNGADVISATLTPNSATQSLVVLVQVNINTAAQSSNTITVTLGDAPANGAGDTTYDNVAIPNGTPPSAREVRTVSTTSVNGLREARGDISATVDNDAQILLALTAPSGPVALGSDITYSLRATNNGARDAAAQTIPNGPSGASTGIFIVAPIPVGTTLKAGQTFPAGTLFSTSDLTTTSPLGGTTTNPTSAITTATWTTTAPADLTQLKRIAFNTGATLAVGASTAPQSFIVTITTGNATSPIAEIADVFAKNSIGANITDQSGDATLNSGDGNANFDEGAQPGSVDGNGIIQYTTLQTQGNVALGPQGQPTASNTTTNDDYTNKNVAPAAIAGVAPGGTSLAASTITYTNTIRNTGNADDTYALTVPTVPANFTVQISVDNGSTYTTVVPGNGTVSLLVPFNTTRDVLVKITAPAALSVLQGFDTVVRATSTNTPANYNETIDRIYTGFLRMDKTATISNTTGVGSATDPVPGAVITYTINYSNVSSSGGTNNVQLTASSIVITENGTAAPNNWGTTTDQVVGSASDARPGATITGDAAGSTSLTDTVGTLAAGQSGTFTFRRRIR